MLDGLRRDHPQVFALARRVPKPRLARTSMLWAVLAAAGAGLLVSSAIIVLARLVGAPAELSGGLATAGATAAGLSVAYTVGGRDAALVYAGILVFERVLGLPGLMRFCLAVVSGSSACSPFSYVLGLWPLVVGAALAHQLARWMRSSDGDGNPLLEVAGALALTHGVVASVLGALLLSATPFESGLLLLVSALAGGAACGLVLLRRVAESRQWRTLGLIALVVLAVWLLVTVPGFAAQVGIGGAIGIGGLNLVGFVSPLVEVGIAALVLYMAAARRVSATREERPQSA